MNNLKHLSKQGWQFVGVTIALSCLPYFFIIQQGSTDSSWTMLLMWMPALAAIIMRLVNREHLFKGISWNPFKSIKWILLAAFIPFVIEIVTIMLTIMLGAGELKPSFLTIEGNEVSIRGMALLFGAGSQPWYQFAPNFILSYFVGTLLYSLVFAFGEEYGWRGYLQKKWATNSNLFALIVIGVIWGLWHLPGILLGHNYPDYPILGGFVLMPFVTTLFSISFGLSFNKTNLIWVPVIFHGAVNISAEMSSIGFIEESIDRPVNDAIWTGLWLISSTIIWIRVKKVN